MGTISSASDRSRNTRIRGGQIRELKNKGLLIYNPKQLFAKLKQEKPEENQETDEAGGSSSEKERKVNALALRAEEGRDYLR